MLVYCQDGKHNLELDILDFIKIFWKASWKEGFFLLNFKFAFLRKY
jgi:hypothetical protein